MESKETELILSKRKEVFRFPAHSGVAEYF